MDDPSFLEIVGNVAVLALAGAVIVYLWKAARGPNRGSHLAKAGLSFVVLFVAANVSNWISPQAGPDDWAATVNIGDSPASTATAAPARVGQKSGVLSSSQETVWIRSNQRLIAKKLKDPASAKFGNDFVSYKAGAPVVCGTVNARNSYGAYSGADRYIGGGDTIGVFLASEVSDFDSLWHKVCR